jgi:DNA polymerase-3 subunit epsilon
MGCWYDGPLVGIDFETTGVDPLTDAPVQAALVWCDGRGWRRTAVWLVDPERVIPDEAIAVHGISTERAHREGASLEETARRVHRELTHAAREGVPIVAMNASFDVTIAAALFARVGLPEPSWGLVIDPLVIDRKLDKDREGKRHLDALCSHYGISFEGAHDAGRDAHAAVSLAREIGRRWPEAGHLDPEALTALERAWHDEWARAFNECCIRDGRAGLDPAEHLWPVRRRTAGGGGGGGGGDGRAQPASDSRTVSMSSSLERGLTIASRMAVRP